MVDVLRIKRRAVGGAAGPPTTLAAAEIAFNEQDNILYYGKGNSAGNATSIIAIGGRLTSLPPAAPLQARLPSTAPRFSLAIPLAPRQRGWSWHGRTGAGTSYIDFHSQVGTDFDFRLIRQSGANGDMQFTNNGTGNLSLINNGFTANFNSAGAMSFPIDRRRDGIVGTVAGTNAAAGTVGEVISSTITTGVAQTNGVASNLTSISLTAGDWDIVGAVHYTGSASVLTGIYTSVSTTSGNTAQGNMLTDPWFYVIPSGTFTVHTATPPRLRLNVSATTTVYLVAYCTFASGSVTAVGAISARRRR